MVYDISAEGAVMGRERAKTDISFRDESISKRHARIYYEGGHWFLEDLGSSNGTKYSRENTGWGSLGRLAANTPVLLEDSAYLLVANVEFRVEIERPVDANATVRL